MMVMIEGLTLIGGGYGVVWCVSEKDTSFWLPPMIHIDETEGEKYPVPVPDGYNTRQKWLDETATPPSTSNSNLESRRQVPPDMTILPVILRGNIGYQPWTDRTFKVFFAGRIVPDASSDHFDGTHCSSRAELAGGFLLCIAKEQ